MHLIQRADASAWASGYLHRALERKEERRLMYVRRRRRWLWNPLCLVGAVLVVWQVTMWSPAPFLVYLGGVMMVPWVVDV